MTFLRFTHSAIFVVFLLFKGGDVVAAVDSGYQHQVPFMPKMFLGCYELGVAERIQRKRDSGQELEAKQLFISFTEARRCFWMNPDVSIRNQINQRLELAPQGISILRYELEGVEYFIFIPFLPRAWVLFVPDAEEGAGDAAQP